MTTEETFSIPAAAMEWQRRAEKGISSNAIFETMTGFPVCGSWGRGYPSDPDDLRRCRLLLDAVPEFSDRLEEMAIVGPEWAELVAIWPQLCSIMDEELKARPPRAPKTYALMKEAISRGWAKRPERERPVAVGRLVFGRGPL